jgi:L-cystine transport system substrate-binding protein
MLALLHPLRATIAALALFLLACQAWASPDQLAEARKRGTLRIGMEGSYPPFNYRDVKSGALEGFDVEFGKSLAERLRLRPEFVTVEWSGMLAGLQSGKFDVVINQVGMTAERRQAFDFSRPYSQTRPQLIVRQEDTRHFASLEDLKGKKLGLGQGSHYERKARAVPGIDVRTYPGAAEYLADLAGNRLDAAFNDQLMVNYLLSQSKLPLRAGALVGMTEPIGIPLRKGNPALQAALDDALEEMRRDGSFARISRRWFGMDVTPNPVR